MVETDITKEILQDLSDMKTKFYADCVRLQTYHLDLLKVATENYNNVKISASSSSKHGNSKHNLDTDGIDLGDIYGNDDDDASIYYTSTSNRKNVPKSQPKSNQVTALLSPNGTGTINLDDIYGKDDDDVSVKYVTNPRSSVQNFNSKPNNNIKSTLSTTKPNPQLPSSSSSSPLLSPTTYNNLAAIQMNKLIIFNREMNELKSQYVRDCQEILNEASDDPNLRSIQNMIELENMNDIDINIKIHCLEYSNYCNQIVIPNIRTKCDEHKVNFETLIQTLVSESANALNIINNDNNNRKGSHSNNNNNNSNSSKLKQSVLKTVSKLAAMSSTAMSTSVNNMKHVHLYSEHEITELLYESIRSFMIDLGLVDFSAVTKLKTKNKPVSIHYYNNNNMNNSKNDIVNTYINLDQLNDMFLKYRPAATSFSVENIINWPDKAMPFDILSSYISPYSSFKLPDEGDSYNYNPSSSVYTYSCFITSGLVEHIKTFINYFDVQVYQLYSNLLTQHQQHVQMLKTDFETSCYTELKVVTTEVKLSGTSGRRKMMIMSLYESTTLLKNNIDKYIQKYTDIYYSKLSKDNRYDKQESDEYLKHFVDENIMTELKRNYKVVSR